MIPVTAKITKKPITAERVVKYIRNGIAIGLTKTAKEGQAAVQGAIVGTFTTRSQWFKQNSPVGIRIKAASADGTRDKAPLAATIETAAYFLPLHETGGIKLPFKNFLAIPASTGPLKNKRKIPAELRPGNLKNSFVIVTKTGTRLLCVRGFKTRGKFKGVTPMYVLVKKAKIKQRNIFEQPIQKVVDRRLAKNIDDGIQTTLNRLSERS